MHATTPSLIKSQLNKQFIHSTVTLAPLYCLNSEPLMASSTELKSDAIFDLMKHFFETNEGKKVVQKVNLVYQFNIAPKKIGFDEVVYTVDLKKGEVKKGGSVEGKPDATFSFKDEDFVKISMGKMNPQVAFMRGAMKIEGSLSAAQKFTPDIFPKPSKM